MPLRSLAIEHEAQPGLFRTVGWFVEILRLFQAVGKLDEIACANGSYYWKT
jgi:hypothetical protein